MIRAASASACRIMLTRAASEGSAGRRVVNNTYDLLAGAIRDESSATVAKAMVGAMLALPGQPELFDEALKQAAAALRERTTELRSTPVEELIEDGAISMSGRSGWLATHGTLLAEANERLLTAGAATQFDPRMLGDLGFVAGMTLAYTRDAISELEGMEPDMGEALPPAKAFASNHRQLAALAESVLLSVHAQVLGDEPDLARIAPALGDFVEDDDGLESFEDGVSRWIAPGGILTEPPYSFDAATFEG
jgi:hypothetical protein